MPQYETSRNCLVGLLSKIVPDRMTVLLADTIGRNVTLALLHKFRGRFTFQMDAPNASFCCGGIYTLHASVVPVVLTLLHSTMSTTILEICYPNSGQLIGRSAHMILTLNAG